MATIKRVTRQQLIDRLAVLESMFPNQSLTIYYNSLRNDKYTLKAWGLGEDKHTSTTLIAGTKGELYQYIDAMIRALNLHVCVSTKPGEN